MPPAALLEETQKISVRPAKLLKAGRPRGEADSDLRGSGDTQAQSAPVYGLAFLLGIKLMPRIRNWKDLKWFHPAIACKYCLACQTEMEKNSR
jgi:hypothetical protein